ncbi:MAG: DUF2232 domain-containing protein [Bacillota bacterium]
MDDKQSPQESKNVRKQFILSLLAVLALTFVNVSFPVLNLAVILIWPVPFVNFAIYQGMRKTSILIAVAGLFNGLLFGPMMGLLTVAGFGFVGFVMAGAILEKLSALKVLLATIAAAIISNLILLVSFSYGLEGSLLENIQSTLMNNLMPLLENGELTVMLEAQIQLISLLLPGLLVVSGMLTGILNYYLAHWYFQIKGIPIHSYPSVARWRFPAKILSLALVISILFRQYSFGLNLLTIVFFLLFLQGFGVGLYYVRKKTKSFFFNWIYVFVVLVIPLIPPLLFVVGLADLWFDIRRIR